MLIFNCQILILPYFNLLRIVMSLCLISSQCPYILISRFFFFFSFLCEILMFSGEHTHKSIIPSKAF